MDRPVAAPDGTFASRWRVVLEFVSAIGTVLTVAAELFVIAFGQAIGRAMNGGSDSSDLWLWAVAGAVTLFGVCGLVLTSRRPGLAYTSRVLAAVPFLLWGGISYPTALVVGLLMAAHLSLGMASLDIGRSRLARLAASGSVAVVFGLLVVPWSQTCGSRGRHCWFESSLGWQYETQMLVAWLVLVASVAVVLAVPVQMSNRPSASE